MSVALLVYDWLLCLGQEVNLIWDWPSGIGVFSVLYGLSRYTALIALLVRTATIHSMSDRVRDVSVTSPFYQLITTHIEVSGVGRSVDVH